MSLKVRTSLKYLHLHEMNNSARVLAESKSVLRESQLSLNESQKYHES